MTASPDAAVRARLAQIGARFGLGPAAVDGLAALLGLLASDPTAPTSVTDPAATVDVHVADSLVALQVDAVRAARRVADLGSGAGFPGLPLALALPLASVTLVESARRKGEFLQRAVDACGATNVEIVANRAEQWAAGLGTCDVVTTRAVATLPVLVEYAAPLLRDGGTLVAWKGRRDGREEADGAAAAAATGLQPAGVLVTDPWPEAHDHHLHLYVKVSRTPSKFPRRAGMATKRPLVANTRSTTKG